MLDRVYVATGSAFVCRGYICISVYKTALLGVSDTYKVSAPLYVTQSLLRMKLLPVRVVRHRNRPPKEVVDAQSVEGALSFLV